MFIFLFLLIAGCTPKHTVVVEKNTVIITVHMHQVDEVAFASSLDQYRRHLAQQGTHGQWSIGGLPNQEFKYFFIVDGSVMIPECRYTVQDDFGSMSCRHLP
nr:hypothetical protein [uncultured Desulfobulbus sp.]